MGGFIELRGGPFAGKRFSDLPPVDVLICKDNNHADRGHVYQQSHFDYKIGYWVYEYERHDKYSALSRDPGHGGYFVPPEWL